MHGIRGGEGYGSLDTAAVIDAMSREMQSLRRAKEDAERALQRTELSLVAGGVPEQNVSAGKRK